MQASKGIFLELFSTGIVTLAEAAKDGPGVDQATIWRWRQADVAFDTAVAELQGIIDEIQGDMVEGTLLSTIATGRASATAMIRWLQTRRPARWPRWQPRVDQGDDDRLMVPLEVLRRIARRKAEEGE